ncbi:MAG: regulatory protein RecX [Mucinivorans sp.]
MYSSSRKIKQDKTPEKALEVAQWLCSKMERTTQDIRRSLYRWGVRDNAEQNKIIDSLVRDKFIDHERYASSYVRDKLSAGRWGVSKIVFTLKQKEIEDNIIAQATQDNVDKNEMIEKLAISIKKWFIVEQPKAKNSFDLRQRIFRRAASRGFEIDDINSIINKIIHDEDQ